MVALHGRADASEAERTALLVAAAQEGVIARWQAIAAGMSPKAVRTRVEHGQWQRRHPGIYAIAGAPRTWHQDLWVPLLALGTDAVVSHRSAAILWGLDGVGGSPLDVLLSGLGPRRMAGVTIHRTRSLPSTQRTVRAGLAVTRPARTLADLAGAVEAEALEKSVDAALRDGLVSVPHLVRFLDRFGGRGRAGVADLRALVADRAERGVPGSSWERRLERLLVAAGHPRPVRQFEIFDDGAFVARLDLAWPAHRVGLEYDSYRHHSSRGAWRHDQVRGNRAAALGWLILRATADDVRASAVAVAERVGQALQLRRFVAS